MSSRIYSLIVDLGDVTTSDFLQGRLEVLLILEALDEDAIDVTYDL